MHRTRNAAYGQPYRGFESLPLRHTTLAYPVALVTWRLPAILAARLGQCSGGRTMRPLRSRLFHPPSLQDQFLRRSRRHRHRAGSGEHHDGRADHGPASRDAHVRGWPLAGIRPPRWRLYEQEPRGGMSRSTSPHVFASCCRRQHWDLPTALGPNEVGSGAALMIARPYPTASAGELPAPRTPDSGR
jgi:hypothetical protein